MNGVLRPLGFEVRGIVQEGESRPLSQRMRQESQSHITKAIEACPPFFTGLNWAGHIAPLVAEFSELYESRPIRDRDGSCGYNTGVILFIAARLAAPSLILESGTYKGASSWIFRNACPKAEIHCFDLDFSKLVYRDSSIYYHEQDWAKEKLPFAVPADAFAFFDDHVNHAQRVLEAQERGFTRFIADDNVSKHTLHRDGLPPVPTIDMIYDDDLQDGDELEWLSEGRHLRYIHDHGLVTRARNAIIRVVKAPDLLEQTGYRPTTLTTFVELRGE